MSSWSSDANFSVSAPLPSPAYWIAAPIPSSSDKWRSTATISGSRPTPSMLLYSIGAFRPPPRPSRTRARSEEHTSELQSLMRISYAVFCLTKKKKQLQHEKHTERQNHIGQEETKPLIQ